MASFTITTELDAAPDAVFALLTDFSRSPEWQTAHSRWPAGEPNGVASGDSFTQELKLMGMPAEVTWTVQELAAPERLALDGAGPMGTTLKARFAVESADGGGSRLTVENEIGGGPLEGPMAETVAAQSEAAQQESLEKLKALLA